MATAELSSAFAERLLWSSVLTNVQTVMPPERAGAGQSRDPGLRNDTQVLAERGDAARSDPQRPSPPMTPTCRWASLAWRGTRVQGSRRAPGQHRAAVHAAQPHPGSLRDTEALALPRVAAHSGRSHLGAGTLGGTKLRQRRPQKKARY